MSAEAFESFNQEQFVAPAPVQEAGFMQRSRERLSTIATEVGGMAVVAAGVVMEKGGDLLDATMEKGSELIDTAVEFVKDEENQETAKRIAKAAGSVAVEGAFGESGLDVLSSDGGIKKVKAAKVAFRAIRNPVGVATSAGKGIVQQGRKQGIDLGTDFAKKRFGRA